MMGLPDTVIPEDKLPQCWSDDVRMNALFAPFRLKSANPESWEMKMKFWSDMLRVWCRCRKDPIVSAGDAKFAFQRKGRTPACIDIVVEEMFRSDDIAPISKYQQMLHTGREGWVRWGARLAFRPAAFALTAVTSLLPARQAIDSDGLPKASIDSTQRFVLESAVKEQATELLQNYPPGLERIGTVEELIRNTNWQHGREVFEVLLGYLVSQGAAVKKDDVIKLAESNKKVSPVTEADEALVKLLSAETRLEADFSRLSRVVAGAEAEARAALQLGNRPAAMTHLRKKHMAQQRAGRCESTLENVRQLLQQMRDVDVNAAIVDTYRVSSQAMKSGMKESGVDEDTVHDTMDDLKEVMETYNEVEKALGGTIDDFDAAELESELRELLAAPDAPAGGGTPGKERTQATGRSEQQSSSEKKSKKLKAPKLPSPPTDRPGGRRVSERDFVFDGEERVIAELNELGIDDASPRGRQRPEGWGRESPRPRPKSPKPSKSWYPPSGECLANTWNNNDGFAELRQDERLHPGQKLNVDFTEPPRLYNTDFQVRDHKMSGGVWLYNNRDSNSNVDSDLAASTEYDSSGSPGKSGGGFQMAPGGERRKPAARPGDADIDDLERRLQKLRGFNL